MGIISYVKEEIQVIRERDPAIKSNMEVFLYPSFQAILRFRVAHKEKTLFSGKMGISAGCKEDGDRDPSGCDDREGPVHRPWQWSDHRGDGRAWK